MLYWHVNAQITVSLVQLAYIHSNWHTYTDMEKTEQSTEGASTFIIFKGCVEHSQMLRICSPNLAWEVPDWRLLRRVCNQKNHEVSIWCKVNHTAILGAKGYNCQTPWCMRGMGTFADNVLFGYTIIIGHVGKLYMGCCLCQWVYVCMLVPED